MNGKIQQIQTILGVKSDGIWGPISKAALDALVTDIVVHIGSASSFADPVDVAMYKKWVQIFLDRGDDQQEAERRALAYGDNGVGVWGDDTTGPDPSCALHTDWLIERWGSTDNAKHRLVLVTIYDKTVTCILKDVCSFRNRVDLNPGAVAAFELTAPMYKPASWVWA